MEDISLGTVESSSEKSAAPAAAKEPAEGRKGTTGQRIFSAALCCYTALDLDDPVLFGRAKSDGFCFNTRSCIDPSADPLGVGCLDREDEAELCKIGGFCCTCAPKKPQPKCTSVGQFLWLKSVRSFPLNPDHVKEPICVCCFLQCLPTVECLSEAPECPAHRGLADVGGGTITALSVARSIVRSHEMER